MKKLARLILASLALALPAMAEPPPAEEAGAAAERAREAADASLDLDAAAVEALRFEVERLTQTSREVLSAPGARSNALGRLQASLALKAASDTLGEAVDSLAAADAQVARALDRRAGAREALAARIETARSNAMVALAPIADGNSVLDSAAQSATAAFAVAEAWSQRLTAGDRLQIDIIFGEPLDLEQEDSAALAAAVQAQFAELVASGSLSVEADRLVLEGRYPEGVSVRDIRSLVEARLLDPGAGGGLSLDLPAPLIVIIERVPAHLSYEPDVG